MVHAVAKLDPRLLIARPPLAGADVGAAAERLDHLVGDKLGARARRGPHEAQPRPPAAAATNALDREVDVARARVVEDHVAANIHVHLPEAEGHGWTVEEVDALFALDAHLGAARTGATRRRERRESGRREEGDRDAGALVVIDAVHSRLDGDLAGRPRGERARQRTGNRVVPSLCRHVRLCRRRDVGTVAVSRGPAEAAAGRRATAGEAERAASHPNLRGFARHPDGGLDGGDLVCRELDAGDGVVVLAVERHLERDARLALWEERRHTRELTARTQLAVALVEAEAARRRRRRLRPALATRRRACLELAALKPEDEGGAAARRATDGLRRRDGRRRVHVERHAI